MPSIGFRGVVATGSDNTIKINRLLTENGQGGQNGQVQDRTTLATFSQQAVDFNRIRRCHATKANVFMR